MTTAACLAAVYKKFLIRGGLPIPIFFGIYTPTFKTKLYSCKENLGYLPDSRTNEVGNFKILELFTK